MHLVPFVFPLFMPKAGLELQPLIDSAYLSGFSSRMILMNRANGKSEVRIEYAALIARHWRQH